MPSSFVRLADAPRKGKSIKSAFESESFDADVTIHVDGLVGSATISPCGRDVALASRAITDINFSAHHPDSLATCSVDGYVYCWDLRRPRQPALAFCDWFAGATQVKYNRQDPYVLASAHDRWLHIWDTRRAVEPLKTISAHTSKIYGIDWNRTKSTCVVTCSLDKSIKFWDYGQDDETPQRVIRTDFPVWRARHTPFGYGLLAMPQTEPGNLYLYDQRAGPETPVDGAVQPTAVFPGHGSHKAKEFLWRSRGGVSNEGIDNREFQLVSWGEDKELRLHKVEPELLESVGHVRGTPLMENLNVTRRGATYKTFRTVNDAIHRDRRIPTMSDRPGSGGQFRQSALSIGLNSSLRRVGPSWRPTSMKAKTNTSRHVDKTQLQIGWMKGISMSKRKPSSDSPGRVHSSLFSPGFDAGWGEPEAIQDEFLRISNQLPNVKWDNIDMDSLTLNASLKGPWGVNRETIFIKVRVDIPTGYPKTKAPRFYVEKSSFMPEETHRKIELELYELANRFLQRKQNCLYMAFSYLLGETDLESSTAFFENVRDLDDDLDALADESSSEEDENDIPTGGSASMSQELSASTELDPSATLASAQRQAVTPLPVYCGARFSNDGRLTRRHRPTLNPRRCTRSIYGTSPGAGSARAGARTSPHGPAAAVPGPVPERGPAQGPAGGGRANRRTSSPYITCKAKSPQRNSSLRSTPFLAMGPMYDSQATTPGSNLAGRVRWGYHPLARDLINDLFDYYEKIADIQMLAMLACIFGDYSMEEEAAIAASHLPQPKTPLPMKAPSFSLEYFPTDPALWNLNYRSQASSAITTPRTANTPALYSDPPSSDETAGFAEPRSHHSYSCGETPPNASREHLREVSQTQSLSTSPSNRLFHRSNSTVAAAIAASLPRALAGIVSGSPPDPIRKRPSPAEAMLNALTPHALVWAGSSTSGAGPDTPGTSRTSFSDDEPLKDDLMAMVPIAVSCVPENQGLFDDDGWISGPLIDRSRFKLYSNYRYAYAEMLQMWGLPLSRLEIMKFDVLKEDALSPAAASKEGSVPNNTPLYPTGAASPTSPFVDRRSMFHELATSGRGLDVTGFCRVHPGVPLEPVEYLRPTNPNLGYGSNPQVVNGSNGVCHRCSAERDGADLVPQTEMRCVYCWEPVTGLFAPCLSCGCVSHEACLADWHAMGGGECPAGHDCYCLEDASNATPDSWAGLQVAVPIWFHGDVERVGPTGQTPRSGTPTTIASARSARSRRKSAPADAARFHMLRRTHTDSSGTTGTEGYGTEAVPHTRPSLGRNPGGGSSRRHNNSYRGHRHDNGYNDDDDDLDHHSHHSHHSRSHSSHRNRPDRDGGGGLLLAGVKPPPRGEEPVSAAQLSLGKRLKKQLEESGRPGVPRRNSGGLAMWKAAGGGG
ncbi:uncharacterized protein THITE_68540 [Thermothielavioides terrestris NRRL 8126]|uniref:WDR59/RTC1-like RING zinc finger domain-containing protein n=1 Tax=Thermothielavioides terrestris (strain ATCC 38088 / NRRL 8126) TaxID=578455 RepID=G2R435_THETT|nr:uncharacterized protein THITE_68540 [Thermothielavioides terrestris NRRL 8126]AEO65177.1 hypothetical protein THITE_68540 [Thermothielavioides terrestris NRRL 8126]